ncbi:Regulator of microtubule dynamics protein [Dirofilaria immitis]
MYDAIDEYLDQYDGQHAYDLIKKMISENEMMNVEIAYRHAHACYILSNFCLSNEDERYRLLEEAYHSCKMACKLKSNNAEILKWSAIITGILAELKSLNHDERVVYMKEFKEFLNEALIYTSDSSVYHMNGRFCYRMATLTEEEKKYAIDAFGSLPTLTIDEALSNFHKAEELNPGHIDNLMYLAKCYIAKGNDSEARKYLVSVLEIEPVDEMDEAQIAETQQLLTDITKYSVQNKNTGNSDDGDTDLEETENSTDLTSSDSEEESNIIAVEKSNHE